MDPVTICNMALLSFGEERIESIAEGDLDSPEAELCATYYLPAVRAVLEERAWLFATGFVDLGAKQPSLFTQGAGSGRFMTTVFTLPGKVIRPLACDDGSGEFLIRWERMGMAILTEDTDKLIAKAVTMVEDPNSWTPNFALAASFKLASLIAGPITHSAAKVDEALKKYESALHTAANLDGMAGSTNQVFEMHTDTLKHRR